MSNVGPATITVANFYGGYGDMCDKCIGDMDNGQCPEYILVIDCCGIQSNQVMFVPGGYAGVGVSFVDNLGNCWEFVSYTTGPATIIYNGSYMNCETCITKFGCPA